MARYLWTASYSVDGVKGLLKEGGSSRRAVIEKMVGDLGGQVEAFYYAFGEDDLYMIGQVPDHVTAAAMSLTVAASGVAVRLKTVVLLTPEEIDEATRKTVSYRAPGG
jgi:uncharacterized protein with GYD domain